ncbi:hypothetical protein H012_gp899 [Acanthamoeba polyphaga moumouvirus]|uniref:Uncharacterized protein n=1 Tax=Acanthamoeba polyphaga moumouvirus TaxID=1269028 RepID=L7RBL5_9VIRU|nr:hypothetical protein H012_gp899 [Acanthamoeba polyphaga moumouvirus]AGC01567.1 hypothetical protein Moumou_00019 [Acanthamoeba polyphaga moumouvirus]AQN67892.1 hypothetical protein [Saudi moumouvirus]
MENNKCPNIINQVADFLKENNHTCVKILSDEKLYKLDWCMKDICVNNSNESTISNKQNKTPVIMKQLCKFLKKKDHECCMIIGMNNHKFKWCMQDVCKDKLMYEDMKRRQAEEDAFVEKLRYEGHTCIYIMESYPSQTGWCRQKICVNMVN